MYTAKILCTINATYFIKPLSLTSPSSLYLCANYHPLPLQPPHPALLPPIIQFFLLAKLFIPLLHIRPSPLTSLHSVPFTAPSPRHLLPPAHSSQLHLATLDQHLPQILISPPLAHANNAYSYNSIVSPHQ